jgi:hypothetical protein
MKLFLPQTTLEQWALEDKADLQDGKLVVPAEKVACEVTPAVHFLKLVSGADEQNLVARVKTQAQLETLGAEHMMDSVLLGETAYEVSTGYLAEFEEPKASVQKAPAGGQASPDADLLAQFILNKL